ncbi:tRNA uridine-5-carboxymethylaminomethyl(34) synthesis GTPase MnmE [Albidovulum sp.]
MDTIFALASARGKAGVSVVRVSGPEAFAAARSLCGSLPEPRRAALRRLRDRGVEIDEALVIAFAAGASFTGEPVVEFHLHGSQAIVNAVLGRLGDLPGLRLAEPGEFTRRAFENGRLDLAQVEGLADLIEAETEAQRRQAMAVLSGAIGERAGRWRRDLVRCGALIEAGIDFSEEDLPEGTLSEAAALVAGLIAELESQLRGYGAAERIRSGFEVAIVGPPNAGKSTLLNRIAGREAAITSEHAGTTRDVIEVRLDLGGMAVTLLDTAGLRESEDPVERLGVERALMRARQADLRIIFAEAVAGGDMQPEPQDIVVCGKADTRKCRYSGAIPISGRTGAGLDLLLAELEKRLAERIAGAAVITRLRHKAALESAVAALRLCGEELAGGGNRPEIAAEYVRRAVTALDSLIGRVDVEAYLDEIFASFCIGK